MSKKHWKIIIDILMLGTILILFQTGEKDIMLHMAFGILMTMLFIVHNILNLSWWMSIGKPHGQEVQRYFQSSDAEHNASCLPPYLLQQYGEGRDESKDAPVSDGAQRHQRDTEHLHPSRSGGCRR